MINPGNLLQGKMRILIYGDSGSGKTYFADKLAQKLRMPIFELEDAEWESKYDLQRPDPVKRRVVDDMIKKTQWIIAGVPEAWNYGAIARSQVILILQESKFKESAGILSRHLKSRLSGEPPQERLIGLLGTIHHTIRGKSRTKRFLEMVPREASDKITFLNSRRDVQRFLKRM